MKRVWHTFLVCCFALFFLHMLAATIWQDIATNRTLSTVVLYIMFPVLISAGVYGIVRLLQAGMRSAGKER